MEREQLKRIFDFLEKKEQQNSPLKWKLINNIPLTEEELNVKGNLDLYDTELTSLPKGLKVGGSLYLSDTKITSLPEGLKVGGSLYLSHSKIESLPKGLKVGGNLYIRNSELKKYTDDELREMIQPGFIKGKILR